MPRKIKILVVDDEAEIRNSLKEILAEEGYGVLTAGNLDEALSWTKKGIDLAMVDILLGKDNGMDLLKKLKEEFPAIPVIMITGHGTVALAAEAFRLGAHDFMEKPLRLVQVRTCVRNALEKVNLRKSLAKQALYSHESPVYESSIMKNLYNRAAKLANLRVPVMILGPSGSGKELIARFLHFESQRSQGSLIATNAASMPISLAEDELFGHEKGAFTGAHTARAGQLEQADGGTLFLDEIADMDPGIQAKLLRVIENNVVTRLGSNKVVPVDVRILCATHQNMENLIQAGKFREDLWFRLSGFVLHVPPLSERKQDIPALADHFLKIMVKELGVKKNFTGDALDLLKNHSFPGNVRELKHIISRAAVFCDMETISAKDLKEVTVSYGDAAEAKSAMAEPEITDFRQAKLNFEESFFKKALDKFKGNITLTAQKIGMAQSNLSRKLKELGLR